MKGITIQKLRNGDPSKEDLVDACQPHSATNPYRKCGKTRLKCGRLLVDRLDMSDEQREQLRQRITGGAEMHRVAERIVKDKRGTSALWREHSAAFLALLFKVSIRDARAVISEMSVD